MFIVRFQGGFANQLFQYAFYLKLTEDYPAADVVADLSHYKTCKDHGGFKLKRFVKLKTNNKSNLKGSVSVNENNYDEFVNNHSENANYYFNGYWQEERFFPKDIVRIKEIFDEKNISKKNRKYIEEIKGSESVSVHVRRGDYVNNFMHGNIANQCYIQNSILFIKYKILKPHFFVFSDDIEWCKKNLGFEESSVTFVEGNSDNIEQDIILMSNCKHNIISNSSFSWWAQNLNANPQKIVVTPEYWFNQKTETVQELVVNNGFKIPNVPSVNRASEHPFFSILIPVYNTSDTLRRTLSTVLNQSFGDMEVIVVDDGSTDNSFEILQSYQSRDARIKLIRHKKNSGLLPARYSAMKHAAGEYFLFLDSDDWLELDACTVLHDELSKNPVDVLEFGYIRENSKEKNPIVKNYENRLEKILSNEYSGTIWNKAYSCSVIKKSLEAIESFSATFAEDYYFSIIFSFFAKSFGYVDNYLHHYMLSTGISTQKDYSLEKFERIVRDVKAIKLHLHDFLEDYSPKNLPLLDDFMKARYDYLAFLANKGDSLYNKVRLLNVLDDNCKTLYLQNLLAGIQEKSSKFEHLKRLSLKQKLFFCLKYAIKRIIDRVKM